MQIDPTKFLLLSLFALVFTLLIAFIYTQSFIEKKRITLVNAEGKKIDVIVEIAADPFKKARGLMFRQSLGDFEGMLFVFDKAGRHGFWMVNTTLALDAIFFDGDKKVVDIIPMHPCGSIAEQCKVYYPQKEAKYVLEVNQGFAEKNWITENCSFYFD